MHLASITALVVVVALGPAPAAAQHARSPDDCLCKHVADCLCSHEGLTCRSLEQRRCWTGTRDITCSPGEDPSHRARIRVIGCPAPRTPMTIALELCLFGVQVGAMLYAAATYHAASSAATTSNRTTRIASWTPIIWSGSEATLRGRPLPWRESSASTSLVPGWSGSYRYSAASPASLSSCFVISCTYRRTERAATPGSGPT